jgi:[CysO sulfur-carrier protein]-S-L-cysteine hydrolase
MKRLVLNNSDLQSIYKHCEREYPNEACGILAGRDGRVETVYSLLNERPSPAFYRIDSREHFRVIREMREAGTELVGIYHSHTGSPAFPSATDVELAYYPEAVYVIVTLMDRRNPAVKGYTIVDEKITEVPLTIVSEGN